MDSRLRMTELSTAVSRSAWKGVDKASGFHRLPDWSKGTNRTVHDLFGKENVYDWELQDGRIVVFLYFQIIKTPELSTRTRKKRTDHQSALDFSQSEDSPARTGAPSPNYHPSHLPITAIKRSTSDDQDSTLRTPSPAAHDNYEQQEIVVQLPVREIYTRFSPPAKEPVRNARYFQSPHLEIAEIGLEGRTGPGCLE